MVSITTAVNGAIQTTVLPTLVSSTTSTSAINNATFTNAIQPNDSSKHKELSVGAGVGIGIGVTAAAVLLLGLVFFFSRRSKLRQSAPNELDGRPPLFEAKGSAVNEMAARRPTHEMP